MAKRVLVPLAEGFEEIEAINIIDVLRRAEIEVLVFSLDSVSEVTGAHGITIKTEGAVTELDADAIDMIVLPGGWGGTERLAEDPGVQALLKAMDERDKLIGAICAAPFALNRAGVLKPRYTCYPGAEDRIGAAGYLGETSQVIEEQNIMTSRGPGTAICFGLQIVRKLVGEAKYEALKTGMLATYCEA